MIEVKVDINTAISLLSQTTDLLEIQARHRRLWLAPPARTALDRQDVLPYFPESVLIEEFERYALE